MARWTTNVAEIEQLAKMAHEVLMTGIAVFKLNNGVEIEGVIRRFTVGNNAGQGGWQYYGECEVETIEGGSWVIDYLDLVSVQDVSSIRHDAYEKAGRR